MVFMPRVCCKGVKEAARDTAGPALAASNGANRPPQRALDLVNWLNEERRACGARLAAMLKSGEVQWVLCWCKESAVSIAPEFSPGHFLRLTTEVGAQTLTHG